MTPYFAVGALVWVAVLKSGVHATVAGVVLGILAPTTPYIEKGAFTERIAALVRRLKAAVARDDEEEAETALGEIEEMTVAAKAPSDGNIRLLQPWVSYIIVPLFALANAGVAVSRGSLGDAVSSSVMIGIVLRTCRRQGRREISPRSWLAVRRASRCCRRR